MIDNLDESQIDEKERFFENKKNRTRRVVSVTEIALCYYEAYYLQT